MATKTGTEQSDTLSGELNNINTLFGLGGNNKLNGGNFIDKLFGGDGNDSLNPGPESRSDAKDTLDGGDGIDTVTYSQLPNRVFVGLAPGANAPDTFISIENLTGTNFDDALGGNDGAN